MHPYMNFWYRLTLRVITSWWYFLILSVRSFQIWAEVQDHIFFHQGVPIDHFTHVPVPFAYYSAESEYNASFTAGIDLAHFRMLNNELLKKYTYVVPEQAPLILWDSKSAICMANNGKDSKHTLDISRIMHFVRNGEE